MKKKSKASLTYKRIVAKFGTSLITGGTNQLDQPTMAGLVDQIARLHQQGSEILVVSSGAIAAGRQKLGLTRKMRPWPGLL